MIHLGDITKLRGWEIPAVDVITGGSPCQNFSVAGNRKGLGGDESVLFYHQIRLVKEMREHDRRTGRAGMYARPRYCVWENVPGAFSSNSGKDFQAVLTEFVRVADPEAPDVPMPEKGKWPKAGCLYDELGRWSVAWRVHDAQFWGVPQRRKRISLVADFGGLSAPEILFERKGLCWRPEPGSEEMQGAADRTTESTGSSILIQNERTGALSTLNNQSVLAFAQNQRDEVRDLKGVAGALAAEPGMKQQTFIACGNPACNQGGMAVLCLNDQGGAVMNVSEDVTGALRAQEHGHQPIVAGFKHKQGALAGSIGYQEEQAPTLSAEQQSAVYDCRGNDNGSVSPTLTGGHQSSITDYTAICVGNGQLNQISMAEQANTLDAMHDQQAVMVCSIDSNKNGFVEMAGTLQAREKAGGYQDCVSIGQSIVRRLTPLECERLQGFPDNWTDIGDWTDSKGKKHKAADSPRYKALGNSIALPFWQYLARRICAQYERPITMASLFDGIGGFPLVFERCGAKAVWASEIEEFPMAVTKVRFKE